MDKEKKMDGITGILAARLLELRAEKKIKQKDAAEGLGISQGLLSHYEKGIRECGLEFLSRAADYYGVTVDWQLGITDDRNEMIPEDPDEVFNEASAEDEAEVQSKLERSDKMMGASVLPVLNRKLIYNGVNVLYSMLEKINSNELTSAVSDDILLAVYNGFRTAYLTNPAHSEDFFGLKDDYYKLLLAAREEGLVNVINASKTANGEAVTEEGLEAEFGTVLSSINNIMKNSENKLRQQNYK